MIRKATIADIKPIYELLKSYGDRGELLPRPLSALYENVRNFIVWQDPVNDTIMGCCSLQICWEDLAEIRSLAVQPQFIGKKIGTGLVAQSLQEARELEIQKVFTLTYQPDFFKKFDFEVIDRGDLPLKIWADCITCLKFPDCDEIAMLKIMTSEA